MEWQSEEKNVEKCGKGKGFMETFTDKALWTITLYTVKYRYNGWVRYEVVCYNVSSL